MRFTLDTVGKTRLAARPAGPADLSRGLRGAGEEARAPAAPAGPRRALHRQRRHADRRLGLQHRHAHRRPAAVHVAAALRAGRRPRAAADELRPRRGRQAHGGSRQGLRRAVRGDPVQGESRQGHNPRRQAASRPCAAGEGPVRDHASRASRGTRQAIRNRVTVDWDDVAPLWCSSRRIPPEVEVKGCMSNNEGRLSLSGPGPRSMTSTLNEFRAKRRMQELVFDLARTLTREYVAQRQLCRCRRTSCFPQLPPSSQRYLLAKGGCSRPPADQIDVFLSPYYGWVIERLVEAIRPDTSQGEAPEVPRTKSQPRAGLDRRRGLLDEPRRARGRRRCHLNYVVADTKQWEQSAAYFIDTHRRRGLREERRARLRDSVPPQRPDARLRAGLHHPAEDEPSCHLILETKGYDPLEEVKASGGGTLGRGGQCRWHLWTLGLRGGEEGFGYP